MNEINDQNEFSERSKYSDPLTLDIHRNVLLQEDANQISGYKRTQSNIREKISKTCGGFSIGKTIKETFPVIDWLPKYKIKENLVGDITSGVTVAVMHIPQGMAYGILAGVSPSVGLYTAIFESFIYFLFGTSRHISIGTFAVVALMSSKTVSQFSSDETISISNSTMPTNSLRETPIYSPIEVLIALTLMTGVVHLIMYVLRLGMLASLLSEPLVNGFTTAAAVHVFVAQTKDIFGLHIVKYKSYFKVIYTVRDVILNIHTSNVVTIQVAFIVLIFMIVSNEFIKPWIDKRCRIPIPFELIAVVFGTILSFVLDLGPTYNVVLVGEIPIGLPQPQFPKVDLYSKVLLDAVIMAIVTYSIVMSMGMMFAEKYSYEIRANQELLALGLSNIVGCVFSCLPTSCALSRSLIQDQAGGKTQITSIVSSGLLLIVILHIGPFFEHLPRCVLAGIIISALKGMFMQAKQLKVFYHQGYMESSIWIITFIGVVVIDIDIGLLLGVICSLISLYYKSCHTHSCLLGQVTNSGFYVNIKHHKNAYELPSIKIFRFIGAINFASRNTFKTSLYSKINLTVQSIKQATLLNGGNFETINLHGIQTIIIDLSSIVCLDPAGCKTLSNIQKEMQALEVLFLLAAPTDIVYEALIHSQTLGEGPFNIYPSIHDAVVFAQRKIDV